LNTYNGNGSATSKSSPDAPNSNNFGIGLVGTSKDNLIERNKIGGNLNGIYIASPAGNVIRRNTIVGNPPVEVSHTFGDDIGKDIQDVSPVGTNNVFEGNDCLTYAGTSAPPPCPSILGWHSWDSRNGYNASGMATTPFQGLFKRASIGRSRLTFPQARLVNAVFHPSGQHLPKAAASAYFRPER
jgi:parallel beta-helix repeat protein